MAATGSTAVAVALATWTSEPFPSTRDFVPCSLPVSLWWCNGSPTKGLSPLDAYDSAFWATIAAVTDAVFTWHDPNLLSGLDFEFSADEELLAARMPGYWTSFAKTGNPNGPGLESWSPFTASAERIKVLDEPAGDLVGYHNTECRFLDQIPSLQAHPSEYTPRMTGR